MTDRRRGAGRPGVVIADGSYDVARGGMSPRLAGKIAVVTGADIAVDAGATAW